MAGIVGEPLNPWVRDQIIDRQKIHGKFNRSAADISYLNNRGAWIKMASGVFLENPNQPGSLSKFGGGVKYPMDYVLFNGQTKYTNDDREQGQINIENTDTLSTGSMVAGVGFGKAYDTSDKDYGIVPMPGIVSLSVKNKNRGSIREANIKIKANSKRQFEIIDEIYLRLGYDMIVEWGWNQYVHNGKVEKMGTTIIEEQWFGKEKVDYLYWLSELEKLRNRYKANYDGFYGKVSNFKWNFEKDGTYSIDIKLISHGDVIESLRTTPASGVFGSVARISIKDYANSLFTDPTITQYTDGEAPSIGMSKETYIGDNGKESEDKDFYQLKLTEVKDRITEYIFNLSLVAYGLNTESVYTQAGVPLWKALLGGIIIGGILAVGTVISGGTIWAGLAVGGAAGGGAGLLSSALDLLSEPEGVRFKIYDKTKPKTDSAKTWSEILKKSSNGYETIPVTFGNGKDQGRYIGQTIIGGKNLKKNDKTPYEDDINHDAFFLWFAPPDTDPDDDKTEPFDPRDMTSYIRFGHLIEIINNSAIAVNEDSGNGICNILTDPIPMYVPPHDSNLTLSYRPSRFIIRNDKHNFNYISEEKIDGGEITILNDLTDNPGLQTKCVYGGINNAIKTGAGIPYVDARNIYIRNTYIFDKIPISSNDNNETRIDLHGFLKSICTDINEALGSINNLEPVVDELTNNVRIMDNTNFTGKNKLLKYLNLPVPEDKDQEARFQIFGYRGLNTEKTYGGFVRDVGLSTKITKEIAAMITIGATAKGSSPNIDATAFSRFNAGKINRFASTFIQKGDKSSNKEQRIKEAKIEQLRSELNGMIHLGVNIEDIDKKREELEKAAKEANKTLDEVLGFDGKFKFGLIQSPGAYYGYSERTDKFFEEINIFQETITGNETVEATTNPFDAGAVDNPFQPLMRFDSELENKNVRTMANMYARIEALRYKKSKSGSPSVGFIPFELGLTLDGISGVKIYSGIRTNVDFLPHNYPETLEFITKGVDHDISGNDWTTKITTIACPKTTEDLPKETKVNKIGNNRLASTREKKKAPVSSAVEGALSVINSESSVSIEELGIKDDAATYDRLRKSILSSQFSNAKKGKNVAGIWDDEGPNLIAIRNTKFEGTYTDSHVDIGVIAYKNNGEKHVFSCPVSTNPGSKAYGRNYFPQQVSDCGAYTRPYEKGGYYNGPCIQFRSPMYYQNVEDSYGPASKKSIKTRKKGDPYNYRPPFKPTVKEEYSGKESNRGMWFHAGSYAKSAWHIGGFSQGCLNFKTHSGMLQFFTVLHGVNDGSKSIGNVREDGKRLKFTMNVKSKLDTKSTSLLAVRNNPLAFTASPGRQYNFHMMLSSQVKKPTTSTTDNEKKVNKVVEDMLNKNNKKDPSKTFNINKI